LFSNALVTKKSLKLSPLIGTGLGSHEISYARFIPEIKRKEGTHLVNVQDAASLFLRLLSETGVLGLGLFLFFLLRFYLRKGDRYPVDLWVVNNSIFLYFIIRLLRVGHYFTDGFFLFFWMYYFSRIKANQEQSLK
jgi:O-antigen ligase